jgi:hypothetical protein
MSNPHTTGLALWVGLRGSALPYFLACPNKIFKYYFLLRRAMTKTQSQIKQRPSVCVAHVSDAVWLKRVMACDTLFGHKASGTWDILFKQASQLRTNSYLQ